MTCGPDIEHKKNRLFFKEFQEMCSMIEDAARRSHDRSHCFLLGAARNAVTLLLKQRFKEFTFEDSREGWLYALSQEPTSIDSTFEKFKYNIIELIGQDDPLFKERYGKKNSVAPA